MQSSLPFEKKIPDLTIHVHPRACMFRKGFLSAAGSMDLGEDVGRNNRLPSDDESSSVDSADEDSPDHVELEAAEEAVIGRWDRGIDVERLPADASFSRHNISSIIHFWTMVELRGGLAAEGRRACHIAGWSLALKAYSAGLFLNVLRNML